MTKEEIIKKLKANYILFTDFIDSLNERDFLHAPWGKWNAGQQLDHLIRAVSPLAAGLRISKFIVRMMFGKANRPSRTYEGLVEKYLFKLQEGGKAKGRFIPKKIVFYKKKRNIARLSGKITQLIKNINSYKEEQLDTFILPHPLLGKVTLREMMYFTIYHAEHHYKQAIRNVER